MYQKNGDAPGLYNVHSWLKTKFGFFFFKVKKMKKNEKIANEKIWLFFVFFFMEAFLPTKKFDILFMSFSTAGEKVSNAESRIVRTFTEFLPFFTGVLSIIFITK